MRREVLLAVLGMAALTALTRLGGVWAGRGPLRERLGRPGVRRWLGALPGAVLVSVVAPLVARGGAAHALAAAVVVAVAARTRSPLVAIAAGMLAAASLRSLGGR